MDADEHQKLELFLVAPIPTKPERFFHDGLPHSTPIHTEANTQQKHTHPIP
jgi:hypothetical protein